MPVRSADDTLAVKARPRVGPDEEESVENWNACFDGLEDRVRLVRAWLEQIDSRMGDSDNERHSRKNR